MTIVKVASKNALKVEGISCAFKYYFNDLQIESIQVKSEVSVQPIGEEVFIGAENRLNELKKLYKSNEYDYLVSCEGGLIKQYNQWFNVQVVMVEDGNGKISTGLSQSYPIPKKYINKIINTELSFVFDELFGGKGGTRMITKDVLTRVDLIKNGTIMALTGMLNGDIW